MLAISLSKDEQYALLLSTLAGLSTAIGGAIAVSDTCNRLWLSLGDLVHTASTCLPNVWR